MLCVVSTYLLPSEVIAQGSAGFMFPHKLGISYQKGLAIDLGLLSYNRWSDRNTINFYDISLGTDVYLTKPFTVAPKVSLDFGVGDWLMFGGGVDITMPTDFSRSTWMLTPKVGLSLASLIRVYYGRHIFEKNNGFPNLGKHRVSLEINIATFHDMKIGL